MGHVRNLLLGVVDGLDDVGGELLEQLGQLMLFRCRIASRSIRLGSSSNASIRIEAADRAVALLEDAATFFEQRFDLLDQFFLVQLVLGRSVGFLNMLHCN